MRSGLAIYPHCRVYLTTYRHNVKLFFFFQSGGGNSHHYGNNGGGGKKGFDIGAIFAKKKRFFSGIKQKFGGIKQKLSGIFSPFLKIKGQLIRKGGNVALVKKFEGIHFSLKNKLRQKLSRK